MQYPGAYFPGAGCLPPKLGLKRRESCQRGLLIGADSEWQPLPSHKEEAPGGYYAHHTHFSPSSLLPLLPLAEPVRWQKVRDPVDKFPLVISRV